MEKFDIIIKTLFGFENLLADELKKLGVSDVLILNRAVKFQGDQDLLYLCNLHLRTALKVLKPIRTFQINNEKQLYDSIRSIDWNSFITPDKSIAVDGFTNSSYFSHSKYIALKTKDAIADQFRDKFGTRPDVDIENPDLKINVHITGEECSVSLDSSGASLGKRGYKIKQGQAPLSEVLAAGLLLLSEWDHKKPLMDPMCGSGTIPIEAALMASHTPPGLFRDFSFQKWNDFNPLLWNKQKEEAKNNITSVTCTIAASDISSKTVEMAKFNAGIAKMADYINFSVKNFYEVEPVHSSGWLIMNPPYGKRLEEETLMVEFYKKIGNHLKHHLQGWEAWIFSGNLEAIKFIGLKPSRKISLFNGPLECKFHKFTLFTGNYNERFENV